MRKQRNKKTLDQYAFGTGLSSVGDKPNLAGVIGDVSSNFLMEQGIQGLSTIFGGAADSGLNSLNFLKDQTGGVFANGGIVGQLKDIEVEGNEVAESPNGDLTQFSGPSHENGGIDTTVPTGTKIFSDRIAIDGKTMQERKLKRERTLKKLEKAGDTSLDKNTLSRTKQFLDMEEEGDLGVQEAANQANVKVNKYAYGTDNDGVGTGVPYPLPPAVDPMQAIWSSMGIGTPASPMGDSMSLPDFGATPSVAGQASTLSIPNLRTTGATSNSKSKLPFSIGDITGMVGNAIGGVAPLATTALNRAGDTPNVNAYKNFGNDALMANSQAKQQAAGIRDNSLENIQLQKNSARSRNRNSATGVNTLRALDLATDVAGDQSEAGVENTYAAQLMQLLGQQSGLENQQDQMVMAGDQARDLADRQDRDSYYTSLGEGFTNFSNSMQKTGKDLNTHEQNQDILDILPDISKYGVGYTYDSNGRPKQKKLK